MPYNFSSINEFSLIPIHMKFAISEIESHGIGPQLFLTIKLTSYQGRGARVGGLYCSGIYLIGWFLRPKASHWSIIFDVSYANKCIMRRSRAAAWIWDTAARPGQNRTGRSYDYKLLQAVTLHADKLSPSWPPQAVLTGSNSPRNIRPCCSPQLKASYLQSFLMTQFLEKSNVDSLYDIMPCWSQVSTPSSRRLAQWNVDILNVT